MKKDKMLDNIVAELKDSELAFMLTESNPLIARLAGEDIETPKRCGLFYDDNKRCMTIEVWPLLYLKDEREDTEKLNQLARYRTMALATVFKRWTDAGRNKHNAKVWWRCKAFTKYLDDICWNDADYIIFRVD